MTVMKEIILTQDIKQLGKLGDKKVVKAGYARNYLVPKGLALYLNKHNLERFESIKKRELKRRAKELADFKAIVVTINDKVVTTKVKTHDEGKLYGSVTPADVVNMIQDAYEVNLDKKHLDMPEHIKEAGEYKIPLVLHSEVTGQIILKIEAEVEVEADSKKGAKTKKEKDSLKK